MSEGNSSEMSSIDQVFDAMTPIVDTLNEGAFHLAYWYDENDPTPIAEAGRRVTRKVVSALGIQADEHLLDVGCGPGGPAVLIAQETRAKVTGVAISHEEVAFADRRAKAEGLDTRVTFQQGNYMSLPYPDATFEGVMAIESLLGAPDLPAALRELHRVVRPGGRFAFCHCTKEAHLDDEQSARFNTSTWGSELPTLQQWIDVIDSAGFAVEEYTQFGSRVLGQKQKYYDALAVHRDDLLPIVGESTLDQFERNMAGFFTPETGTIGYAVIAGRRSKD